VPRVAVLLAEEEHEVGPFGLPIVNERLAAARKALRDVAAPVNIHEQAP
jgi:glutamate mutase epsilon subunit